MVEADDVECTAVIPDLVGVDTAGRFVARPPCSVSHFERVTLEDTCVQRADRIAKGFVTFVGPAGTRMSGLV